jgi:ubiquinone/menaquinone biosynthesis C-methylase UbiE
MASAVTRHQAGRMDRVLDFGCGVGRMTRWVKPCLNCGEVYGTDIDSTRASWCVNNLGSVGRFWTQTTHPHLPVADGTFDLIICGSIFTHIDDLSEAWLMELARTLRKGGLIYITLHDEKAMQWLQEHDPQAWILRKMKSNPAAFRALGAMPRKLVVGRFNRSQVFYQRRYFIESLRRDFTHLESMEQAYGFQTGLLFRRN